MIFFWPTSFLNFFKLKLSEKLPLRSLNSLGFIDGNNIIISEPDQLSDIDKWLVNNPKKAEKMAMNGQQLILKKHTFENRIQYIKYTFKRILESKFQGSFWAKGDYHFR